MLGESVCWLYDGSYHFRLPLEGWTLAITPESAHRFRVEACRGTVPAATVWVGEDDLARLGAIVHELRDRAALALAGA